MNATNDASDVYRTQIRASFSGFRRETTVIPACSFFGLFVLPEKHVDNFTRVEFDTANGDPEPDDEDVVERVFEYERALIHAFHGIIYGQTVLSLYLEEHETVVAQMSAVAFDAALQAAPIARLRLKKTCNRRGVAHPTAGRYHSSSFRAENSIGGIAHEVTLVFRDHNQLREYFSGSTVAATGRSSTSTSSCGSGLLGIAAGVIIGTSL